MNNKAVVLLSGGLDSATTLAIAVSQGYQCCALSFRYGQRHRHELAAAATLARTLGAADHRVIDIDLAQIGGSALTDPAIDVPKDRPDTEMHSIPPTYVPARNTVFLSYALAFAEVIGARAIFIGVNSLDYSGYPDCRPEFIDAFQKMANLATKAAVEGCPIEIKAPLIDLTKAQIIKKGIALGLDYSLTHSCYDPTDDGLACGRCDSCTLRKKGFAQANLPDPTKYASNPD